VVTSHALVFAIRYSLTSLTLNQLLDILIRGEWQKLRKTSLSTLAGDSVHSLAMCSGMKRGIQMNS